MKGRDTTALSRYEISSNKKLITLKVEYTFASVGRITTKKDSSYSERTTSLFEKYFGSSTPLPDNTLNDKKIAQILYNSVAAHPDLEIVPMYPEYIKEMIKLVKGKKKKEQAGYLYSSQNTEIIVKREQKRNYDVNNGVFHSERTFVFYITLKVNKKTKFLIPAFNMNDENTEYYAKEMLVEL